MQRPTFQAHADPTQQAMSTLSGGQGAQGTATDWATVPQFVKQQMMMQGKVQAPPFMSRGF